MGKKVFKGAFGFQTPELTDTLRQIESTHKIPPVDLARGLLEAACKFYSEHGWFAFPVVIYPEKFQRDYLAAEENQSHYSTGEEPPVDNQVKESVANFFRGPQNNPKAKDQGAKRAPRPARGSAPTGDEKPRR